MSLNRMQVHQGIINIFFLLQGCCCFLFMCLAESARGVLVHPQISRQMASVKSIPLGFSSKRFGVASLQASKFQNWFKMLATTWIARAVTWTREVWCSFFPLNSLWTKLRNSFDWSLHGQAEKLRRPIYRQQRGTRCLVCKDRKTWEDWPSLSYLCCCFFKYSL